MKPSKNKKKFEETFGALGYFDSSHLYEEINRILLDISECENEKTGTEKEAHLEKLLGLYSRLGSMHLESSWTKGHWDNLDGRAYDNPDVKTGTTADPIALRIEKIMKQRGRPKDEIIYVRNRLSDKYQQFSEPERHNWLKRLDSLHPEKMRNEWEEINQELRDISGRRFENLLAGAKRRIWLSSIKIDQEDLENMKEMSKSLLDRNYSTFDVLIRCRYRTNSILYLNMGCLARTRISEKILILNALLIHRIITIILSRRLQFCITA